MKEEILRKELLDYLGNGHAHRPFLEAVRSLPENLRNRKAQNVPYTFWQLLEHIRIAQHDMVDFIKNAEYEPLSWPDDYWPQVEEEAVNGLWDFTVLEYKKDLEELMEIVKDPRTDLLAPIPHGEGQSVFKEVLQVIDHAAYHMGEFVLMQRALGAWRE